MPIDWNTPPEGIPTFAWKAAQELLGRRIELDLTAESEATYAGADAGHALWCRAVADIITSHIPAHRLMVEHGMEVTP